MKTKFIDATLNGVGAFSQYSYFFHVNQYVRYDWATDKLRVSDGYPNYNIAWAMPEPFNSHLDTALNGRAAYNDFAYFFNGSQYQKYSWTSDSFVFPQSGSLSAWKLTGDFALGVDAAINGVGKTYENFAYFFKNNQYVCYNWIKDALEKNAQNKIFRPLSDWKLPPSFLSGIDAVVNGIGQYAGFTYFFKEKEYCTYNWSNNTCSATKPILDNWLGLHELLDCCEARTLSLFWIDAAISALAIFTSNSPHPDKAVINSAMKTHFHIDSRTALADKTALLATIASNFVAIRTIIANALDFRWRTAREKLADWNGNLESASNAVLYTFFGGTINFSSGYVSYGPKCQSAMLTHEAVHKIDNEGTHVSEWDNSAYMTLTAQHAVHNPSCYAAFSQHIYYKSDTRYGAGKPNE